MQELSNGLLMIYGTFYAASNNQSSVIFPIAYMLGYTGLCTSAVGSVPGGVEYKQLTGFNATLSGGGGTRCWFTIGY